VNSERQKREEEIARLVRGAGPSREADVAFQERLREAASAIVEEEKTRIQKTERAERRRRSISPAAIAPWLLVLGVGIAFSIPSLGVPLIFCGLAVLVWTALLKHRKKSSGSRSR
jgi:hypothetical protein